MIKTTIGALYSWPRSARGRWSLQFLRREAAEYADLARRLEDLTATRSEVPLLVVSLGPGSGLTILYSS